MGPGRFYASFDILLLPQLLCSRSGGVQEWLLPPLELLQLCIVDLIRDISQKWLHNCAQAAIRQYTGCRTNCCNCLTSGAAALDMNSNTLQHSLSLAGIPAQRVAGHVKTMCM